MRRKSKLQWTLLSMTVVLALAALLTINSMATQIRQGEQGKVKIWAGSIIQKTELVRQYDLFFNQVKLDEKRKIGLYTSILESFNDGNMGADLNFSLAYVNYLVDSSKTPIIITDRDSIITVPNELAGKKMSEELLQAYGENEPFHYRLWGMPMTLYYKETAVYTNLRHVLWNFTRSYLNEITNNAVSAPVVIVDSSRTHVLESGNVEAADLATPTRLARTLRRMEGANAPIRISLAEGQPAYVYYEDTPLLRLLNRLPLLYLFVAVVLIVVSYHLFRTAQSDEQNRIWVGMAKETAHQLGTPISSLMAWNEVMQGKTYDERYSNEIKKDLDRLDTIARRFSKIGSVPELKEGDVSEAVRSAVAYLQPRVSKKVTFVVNAPDEPATAPLNRYLFEWVIENLCKNAVDAMDGKGQITLTVHDDARCIHVDVADTGKGIAPANQKRIFDSGFTTKQRGWGLGLSLARRIIDGYHRGKIALKYSVEGQGSVFQITLKKSK